jgi:tol-pal system protein YbgF
MQMQRTHSRWAAAVLAAAVLSGPVAAADKQTEARLGELEQRMQRIDRLLSNQALLEMQQLMTELQEELRLLRGDNERLRYELGELKTRQRELYIDVDRRLQQMEVSGAPAGAAAAAAVSAAPAPGGAPASAPVVTAPAAAPAPSPAAPAAAAPPAAAVAAAGPSLTSPQEREAYKDALNLLKEGRNTQAASAFRSFLADYPQSGYASNAQYWLGEAHYVSKDYPAAVTEFGKVVSEYPSSNKVADAQLKLGFTFYELRDWAKARQALETVKQAHAGTTAARLADQRLRRMEREGH